MPRVHSPGSGRNALPQAWGASSGWPMTTAAFWRMRSSGSRSVVARCWAPDDSWPDKRESAECARAELIYNPTLKFATDLQLN